MTSRTLFSRWSPALTGLNRLALDSSNSAPAGVSGTRSLIALTALVLCAGCDPSRPPYVEKTVEGNQFAHYLEFPSKFRRPTLPKQTPLPGEMEEQHFFIEHLGFRTVISSPNVLLVAGCGYFGYVNQREEACSPNSFSIDTARQYAISEAGPGEWEHATAIPGAGSLRSQVINQQDATRITRNGLESGETSGWTYRGQTFLYPRGDDFRGSSFMASADGNLVLLIGVNKRKLPKGGFIVGTATGGGLYGNYTIDVFRSKPQQRIAALEMDCNFASNDCMQTISLANSRWFAVTLADDFSRVLLFDFGQSDQGKK
jgi:hypothetical protein